MEREIQLCECTYINENTIEFIAPYDVFINVDRIIITEEDSEKSRIFEEAISE